MAYIPLKFHYLQINPPLLPKSITCKFSAPSWTLNNNDDMCCPISMYHKYNYWQRFTSLSFNDAVFRQVFNTCFQFMHNYFTLYSVNNVFIGEGVRVCVYCIHVCVVKAYFFLLSPLRDENKL